MRIIVLLFGITFLFADIVDVYRFDGIEKVQNILEQKLQSKNYWLNKLKNKDVKFGYFEDPKFVLFCNKKNKILSLYAYKNDKFRKVITFKSIITGKLGDKLKQGDLITPIGDYILINKIKPQDSFYGPLAFVTNYPNTFDKLHNKNGYGIWIHGKPLDGSSRPSQSKGCIVLDNSELLTLSKLINYQKTELLITEKPFYATKEDIASILAMLYQWRAAWRESNLEKYKQFYDKEFKSKKGLNLKEFLKYKKRVFDIRKNQKVKIFFKNISIIPYQNISNKIIYKITFYEKYLTNTGFKFEGNKELFVIKRKNNFKILIE